MERFVYYRDPVREETEKTVTECMEQIICADEEKNKIIEFLKGKEWKNYVKGIYYKGSYSLGCKYILKQRKKNTNCYFVIYRYFSNK